jgi:uncharacterized protein with WD repeat
MTLFKKEFKPRACLQISWAPQGQYVVLATSKRQQATSCHLEFYDTGSANSNDIVMLNKVEHENMTDYEWDPTGRYFVSYVSYWNHRVHTLLSIFKLIFWSYNLLIRLKNSSKMRISCITSKVNKCKNKRMKNSTSLVGDQDHKAYCRPTKLKYASFVTEI